MTKKSFIITVVLMFFIVATAGFAYADKYQWKLADTDNDCKVFTSDVPGKEYIAAKATCVIPARIETVGVVIRDIPSYPEWMQDCKETKELKVLDDKNDIIILWFRQHVTLYKDRDMVLRSELKLDLPKSRNFINVESTNEMQYDSGKGYVRMPSFYNLWTLEWIDREHTRVTFMIDPDPGEGIPKIAANPIIKSTPLKTLHGMMKQVKKAKYIEAAKTSKYKKYVDDAIKAGYVK